MKNYLKIICLVLFASVNLPGQTLEENQVDEFTKNTVKRTSWEVVNMTMTFTAYFRASQINTTNAFDLKMMLGSGAVFSIPEGAEMMFKLSNDSIVKIPCIKSAISCSGCGAKGFAGSQAQGVNVSYFISKENLALLKNSQVTKIRIYTRDGFVEDEIKAKNADKIRKALALIE